MSRRLDMEGSPPPFMSRFSRQALQDHRRLQSLQRPRYTGCACSCRKNCKGGNIEIYPHWAPPDGGNISARIASVRNDAEVSVRPAPRCSERFNASAELLDDIDVLTPDVGLTDNAWTTPTATVVENDSFLTEFPIGALPLDSFNISKAGGGMASCAGSFSSAEDLPQLVAAGRNPADVEKPNEGSNPVVRVRKPEPVDLNQSIYYKNRLEFSLDGGWLPINIPFVFDVFLGDRYTKAPLNYTLVPVIASLRWQMDDVGGPWIFRGNWDLTASGAVTVIPRGPETRYFAWIMGVRRNFVPRHGRIAPYFDGRLGLGNIDAKEPLGAIWAQGQNFTFTMNMGSGVRYNFNPRYSISAGLNWMHISNLYLSEPKFANYGINVYGPMLGIDIRLGKPRDHGSE